MEDFIKNYENISNKINKKETISSKLKGRRYNDWKESVYVGSIFLIIFIINLIIFNYCVPDNLTLIEGLDYYFFEYALKFFMPALFIGFYSFFLYKRKTDTDCSPLYDNHISIFAMALILSFFISNLMGTSTILFLLFINLFEMFFAFLWDLTFNKDIFKTNSNKIKKEIKSLKEEQNNIFQSALNDTSVLKNILLENDSSLLSKDIKRHLLKNQEKALFASYIENKEGNFIINE